MPKEVCYPTILLYVIDKITVARKRTEKQKNASKGIRGGVLKCRISVRKVHIYTCKINSSIVCETATEIFMNVTECKLLFMSFNVAGLIVFDQSDCIEIESDVIC